MKDINRVHEWFMTAPPAGSGIWPRCTGRLTGHRGSFYHALPDYFCPHIVVRGRGTVTTAAGSREVRPGDLFTLWPGVEITYAGDPRHPWVFYWIHLDGAGVESYMRACGFAPHNAAFRAREPVLAQRLFRQVHDLYGRRPQGEQAQVIALLYRLASACAIAPGPTVDPDAGRSLVGRAMTLITGSPTPGLSVAEVAKALGVDRTTLFRAFRSHLRTSPQRCIMDARIRRAQALLHASDAKLSQVARMAGFSGEKYFLRRFHLATGQTPSQWRRRRPARRDVGASDR